MEKLRFAVEEAFHAVAVAARQLGASLDILSPRMAAVAEAMTKCAEAMYQAVEREYLRCHRGLPGTALTRRGLKKRKRRVAQWWAEQLSPRLDCSFSADGRRSRH